MYIHSIIKYLIWPALILVSYLIIRLALKKMEVTEQERKEKKPETE